MPKGRLACALVVAAIAILAACSSSVTGVTPAPEPVTPVVTLPGGGTTLNVGSGKKSVVSVSEAGYTGSFSSASSDTHVATISPRTSKSKFVVHAKNDGTSTMTITDEKGHASSFQVTVSNATPTPSPTPSMEPTTSPTSSPTSKPTTSPTSSPTAKPTTSPTASPTAKPTTSPTASPTARPTATPTPVADPHTIAFTAIDQTKTVTVTETGYNGTFTASSSDTTVAKVTPASGSAAFTVKAIGAGTATITFTDSHHNTATVSVGVTTTGGGIGFVDFASKGAIELHGAAGRN